MVVNPTEGGSEKKWVGVVRVKKRFVGDFGLLEFGGKGKEKDGVNIWDEIGKKYSAEWRGRRAF